MLVIYLQIELVKKTRKTHDFINSIRLLSLTHDFYLSSFFSDVLNFWYLFTYLSATIVNISLYIFHLFTIYPERKRHTRSTHFYTYSATQFSAEYIFAYFSYTKQWSLCPSASCGNCNLYSRGKWTRDFPRLVVHSFSEGEREEEFGYRRERISFLYCL